MHPKRSDTHEQPEQESPEQESSKLIHHADLSRRDIRSLIFHYLYAAEACDYKTTFDSLVETYNQEFNLNIPTGSEAYTISSSIINERDNLDAFYEKLLTNWRPERISTCTRLILRIGVWELLRTDTDTRIIINEAIELAKCFAESDAYRFINGLLDRVVKEGLVPNRMIEESEEEED